MGWNRRFLMEYDGYTPPYLPGCGEKNPCLTTEAPSPSIISPKDFDPGYLYTGSPPDFSESNLPPISVIFNKTTNNHRNLIILATSAVLATCFLILVYYTLIIRCRFLVQRFHRHRTTTITTTTVPLNPTPRGNGVQDEEEDADDDLVEEGIHHVWYIRTAGLDQNTIDSITICPYRKADGLIDGTDCSVCLSEFDEGEVVRLLPKCSHAFHVPCIDTWLRAHVNCPLCRAPIISTTTANTPNSTHTDPTIAAGQLDSSPVPVSPQELVSGADFSEPPQILQINRVEDGGSTGNSITGIQNPTQRIQELLTPPPSSSSSCNSSTTATSSSVLENGFRVQSDLGRRFCGRRVARPQSIDGSSATLDMQQPTRRSISMDFSSRAVVDGGLYQDRKESILGPRLPPISSSSAIMEKQWCEPKRVSTLGFGRSTSNNGGGNNNNNNKLFLSRFGRGIRSNSNSGNSVLPP